MQLALNGLAFGGLPWASTEESVAPFDFSEVPRISTDRLLLRRIDACDRNDWLSIFNSPGTLDYLIDFERTPREDIMPEIVDWAERIFRERSGIRWAITTKSQATMIGSCGFHRFDPNSRRAEIGYELHSAYWRRGIMSEAVTALLAFCFDRLCLHRVEADVTEGNLASAALLKKLGFTLEGVWRERERWRGGYQSMWQFGLLAPEYRAGRIKDIRE